MVHTYAQTVKDQHNYQFFVTNTNKVLKISQVLVGGYLLVKCVCILQTNVSTNHRFGEDFDKGTTLFSMKSRLDLGEIIGYTQPYAQIGVPNNMRLSIQSLLYEVSSPYRNLPRVCLQTKTLSTNARNIALRMIINRIHILKL